MTMKYTKRSNSLGGLHTLLDQDISKVNKELLFSNGLSCIWTCMESIQSQGLLPTFAIKASKFGSGLRDLFDTNFLRQVGHSLFL